MKPIFFFAVRAALLGAFLPLLLHAQDNCGNAVYNQRPGLPVYQNLSFEVPIGPALGDPGITDTADAERLIIFLHGFNGTSATWLPVSMVTDNSPKLTDPVVTGYPRRNVVTENPTFNGMDINLTAASSYFEDQLDALYPAAAANHPAMDMQKTFLIAKSLGGLVARNSNQAFFTNPTNRRFHGLVTISTPHRGAPVVANVSAVQQFGSEACSALSAGPTAGVAYDFNRLVNIANRFGMNLPTFDAIRDTVCSAVGNKFIKALTAQTLSGAMLQIAPGSTQLNALNAGDSLSALAGVNIPTVCFFGVEDGPEFWRELHHLVNSPADADPFEANEDDGLANFADSSEQHYYNEYISNAQQAQSLNSQAIQKHSQILATILLPAFFPYQLAAKAVKISKLHKEYTALIDSAQECAAASPRWKQGYDWWASANNRYLTLNGGLTVGYDTTWTCHCWREGVGKLPIRPVANENACTPLNPSDDCTAVSTINIVTTHHDNDGMVPAWSSGSYPGLNSQFVVRVDNQYYTPQYLNDPNVPQGANHEQINNSANTKKMMNDLLNGKHGLFFRTDKY